MNADEVDARLQAIEALIQQAILRMASVADPDFGDIIEGTADQMVSAIAGRMKHGPEVLVHVERILTPVRREAASHRARSKMRETYRGFDD